MRSVTPPNLARHLVNAFAAVESTEELILFVAGTDHMLSFCQELVEMYDRDSRAPLAQEVNALCRAQAILPGVLYAELRKVLLALNRFYDASRDHYAVLGLSSTATRDEVKQAYRTLSKQYHPDRLRDSADSSQQFMEIAGAYHAIMSSAPLHLANSLAPWREQRRATPTRRPRSQRLFFLGIAVLICILAGGSIYLAGRYDKEMIINQLQAGGSPSKDTVAQKVPADTSDTPKTQPAADPSPGRSGQQMETGQPREGTASAASENRQGADNPSPQLPPVATPASSEPLSQENICLAETDSDLPVKHNQPAKPITKSMPAPKRQDSAQQESLSSQGRKRTPHNSSPPEPSPAQVMNKPAKQQPVQAQPVTNPEEIISLIKQYSTLYSRRELPLFLALFSEDAMENGQPLPRLTDQYRSLFAHTQAINLDIENMNWDEQSNGFRARGNFRSSYTYNDGRTKEHMGDITFFLIRERGILKIQTLEYSFIE